MTRGWAWASAVALCAFPLMAQAGERARERGDGDRGRAASQHRRDPGGHPSGDSRREGGGRRDSTSASRRDASRGHRDSERAHEQRRGSDRGDSHGGYSRRESRDRHDDHGWVRSDGGGRDRGRTYGYHPSHRPDSGHGHAYSYRRPYPRYGYRPYYRYGYFYGHGYYFPRYYFDVVAYPSYSSIRTLVGPRETEVYVDGYYAGVVDDFDGFFQRLRVAPGPHEIALRLDGFLTWTARVFAAPGQTVDLHHDMVPGVDEPGAGLEPYPGNDGQPGVDAAPYGDVPPGGYEQQGGDEPPYGADEDAGPPPRN